MHARNRKLDLACRCTLSTADTAPAFIVVTEDACHGLMITDALQNVLRRSRWERFQAAPTF